MDDFEDSILTHRLPYSIISNRGVRVVIYSIVLEYSAPIWRGVGVAGFGCF